MNVKAHDTRGRRFSIAGLGHGFDARTIATTGVMIAVVFVMTRYITFSIGPGGYLRLGDIGAYVTAFLFGPLVGFIAAGVGISLADLSLATTPGRRAPSSFTACKPLRLG